MILNRGRSTVRFSDVAALIDPTTVTFTRSPIPPARRWSSRTTSSTWSAPRSCMQRYLDRTITVEQSSGDKITSFTGTLTSTAGGVILKDANGGVQIINGYSNVRFPELPGGLITKPTLVWDVSAEKAGPHRTRVTYQTGGMTWWADYNLIFAEGKDANSGVLDVGAWVSIINQSGAGYPDAKLKLIAGDVHRAPAGRRRPMAGGRALAKAARRRTGFEEKAFFEYHLYTLGRPTTLPDNSTKQIELFPDARGVPCEKVLVYYGLPTGFRGVFPNPMTDRNYGTESNKKVDIYLRFKNAKDNGLGMPLPVRPHPRQQARPGRQEPRVHRRGHHRPHAQGRAGADQAGQRLRRGRRAQAGRLQDRHSARIGSKRKSRSSCATTRTSRST